MRFVVALLHLVCGLERIEPLLVSCCWIAGGELTGDGIVLALLRAPCSAPPSAAASIAMPRVLGGELSSLRVTLV